MKTLILFSLLAFASCNTPIYAASYVYQDSNIQVILRDTPCKDAAILSVIEEPFRPQFRAADIVWQGKPLKGCWAAFPDRGQALIVDETGDYGPLPLGAFKPLTGI
jgi:hypothetical protein